MNNKELFNKIKNNEIPITIEHIKTICDPVFKVLDVEQKNIEVFDYEEKVISEVFTLNLDDKNVKPKDLKNIIQLGARTNNYFGTTIIPAFQIKGFEQRPRIFLDIKMVKPQTDLFSSYAHEIGHVTQKNGEPIVSEELIKKAKDMLNEEAGKEYFTDMNIIKSVVKEYTAYLFEREFEREFFNQYHHKFVTNTFLKFSVPSKLRMPNVLGNPELNNTALLCQYLGKNFTKLETLHYHKPGYEGKIPYRSDEGELWL